jgi:photosystem II stability/assembly factor-like uncharacterized protein
MRGRWLVALALAAGAVTVMAGPLSAQAGRPPVNASSDPALRDYQWRSIGPVGMGGRVDEIAVVEREPRIFYVGYATGGLWKTENAGTTFEPVFDSYGTHSIGSVAVSQSNPDIVWVGTGEANNRQSSSFGDGVYKSTDAGRTWTHMGLRETQTINRLIIHPTNPDIVWVAATGPLFNANAERGVYRTADGGRTWEKTLYIDENTGATDIVYDPSNPEVLYAAMYQRRRAPFAFVGGGPGSGIHKSTDGGRTWTRLSGNGLPGGTMGRIALDVARSNPNIVYAQIEVAPDRTRSTAPPQNTPDPERNGVWRSTDGGQTWEFRSNHNIRPMYFSILRVDPQNPEVVYTGGVQFYRSEDGGRTFNTVPGFGHVDHHAIWINPRDSNHFLIGNDGSIDITYDRGRSFDAPRLMPVAQFYQVSVDMRRPYNVCGGLQDNGSWCGPSMTRGGSILGTDWFGVGGGDGFYTAVDPTDWRIIYSESQNGNPRRYDLAEGTQRSIRPAAASNQNPNSNISPAPPAGTSFRWNWSTPFMLSHHNPQTIYMGSNVLFRSFDRGDTWQILSPDLTTNPNRNDMALMGQRNALPNCTAAPARGNECILSKNDGISFYGTIITLAESPLIPGVVWVGTDDGNVQVTRDHGATWANVTSNIRGPGHWVSRVEASYHDPATAFISIDGHRTGDLRPYVYVTRDWGQTWQNITANLPEHGNVNVIKQDPRNPDLLYVGTEFGFHISLDQGASWKRFMTGLPVVRVDDVMVHPRDNDLVLATHGRSVLIMDDVTALQQLTPAVMQRSVHLMEPREAVLWKTDQRNQRATPATRHWRGQNPPRGTAISFWLAAPARSVQLTISDPVTGEVFRTLESRGEQGLNRVHWNLQSDPVGQGQQAQRRTAQPGTYIATLTVDGQTQRTPVRVLEDIWMQM